jgi:hypothetical protein
LRSSWDSGLQLPRLLLVIEKERKKEKKKRRKRGARKKKTARPLDACPFLILSFTPAFGFCSNYPPPGPRPWTLNRTTKYSRVSLAIGNLLERHQRVLFLLSRLQLDRLARNCCAKRLIDEAYAQPVRIAWPATAAPLRIGTARRRKHKTEKRFDADTDTVSTRCGVDESAIPSPPQGTTITRGFR